MSIDIDSGTINEGFLFPASSLSELGSGGFGSLVWSRCLGHVVEDGTFSACIKKRSRLVGRGTSYFMQSDIVAD